MRVQLYLGADTAIARLDPRVKLGILATFFVSAFVMESALWVLPLAFVLVLLLVSARAVENVRPFAPLFVIAPIASFVIWSFFYRQGQPVPLFGALGVTWEAMRYGLGMGLKLACFLAASLLYLSITRVEEFTDTLRSLGLPYRASFAVALSFRLVPLFLDSALTVVDAQRARGLDFGAGTVFERIRRYGTVIVPVFMGALRRADFMAMTLEARGFGRLAVPTRLPRPPLRAADMTISVALFATAAFYLYARWRGWGRVA